MIGTAVNQQIKDKYLELIKENYSEPEDELILGSFENCKDDLHIPQTLQYLVHLFFYGIFLYRNKNTNNPNGMNIMNHNHSGKVI